MNDWYQQMVSTLQLNGKGEPTQKAYTRAGPHALSARGLEGQA
jgi:hypothetical protein